MAGHIRTREPGVVASAPESFQVRETNLKPELVREAATKSSASSQHRKRAASADSAGTSSSSIRREVGSSGSDRQPRHVKIVDAGGVAAGDLGLFVVRHPGQDLKPRVTSLGRRDGRAAVGNSERSRRHGGNVSKDRPHRDQARPHRAAARDRSCASWLTWRSLLRSRPEIAGPGADQYTALVLLDRMGDPADRAANNEQSQ